MIIRTMGLLLVALALPAQAQTVRYIHTDALGSVVAVTDANRNVVERREYAPFGTQLTPAVSDGPGYTGHVQDAATGLTYMQQRYYDPGIGRFLSVDPVAADPNTGVMFNRYRYANNNPYKFTDPDGRIPVETIWDVANVAMGVTSAYSNFSSGSIGAGAIDIGGVLVDAAATLIPYVPGGAGTAIKAARAADKAVGAAKANRAGRQAKLREIANDPKASSADRGWIKNEQRQIEQGNRTSIRNPLGKELAHERGREAARAIATKIQICKIKICIAHNISSMISAERIEKGRSNEI